MTISSGNTARERASRGLDRVWARGATLTRAEAHERLVAMANDPMLRFDAARMDGMLRDLAAGGLLVEQPTELWSDWIRPERDLPLPEHKPEPVMWIPGDGSAPRPYSDFLAEQPGGRP